MELTPALFRALLAEHPRGELARRMGLDRSTISRWASHSREPGLADALRSLRELGFVVTVAAAGDDQPGIAASLSRAALAVRRASGG
jgi:transcriptional regulator with XRE-family HTH domain